MNKPLLLLVGPTSVGKTDVSIELAQRLDCEIISADSMMVYRYMNIGTAKPSPDEMNGIAHHMIDEVYPDEDFSVAVFRERAGRYIDDILSRGKLPLVVGGTGLYINSLTHNLDFSDTVSDPEYRIELNGIASSRGNEYVHRMLKDIDPDSYRRLHPNDLKRIIRALEVYRHTGRTITEYQASSKIRPIEYDVCMIGLYMERSHLYQRINARVDSMIERGLVDEVKGLLDMGYGAGLVSMQGLGYKEIVPYISGECSISDAKDTLKKNTRHFAKRQMTWFRRESRIHWIDAESLASREALAENIVGYIAGKLRDI